MSKRARPTCPSCGAKTRRNAVICGSCSSMLAASSDRRRAPHSATSSALVGALVGLCAGPLVACGIVMLSDAGGTFVSASGGEVGSSFADAVPLGLAIWAMTSAGGLLLGVALGRRRDRNR